jgi:hypothetical protein
LAALVDRLAGCERLVLLGDVLELRHGPLREALGAADRVLRAIGAALGGGREVVIVPGNHDHRLLAGWLERRAVAGPPDPLGLESAVDWRAGELLGAVADRLAPASVRAAYPGVWLRPDVYATHGHYGDRHTTVPVFERRGAGAIARLVREPPEGPRRAEDYEATLAPIYAWVDAVAQADGHGRARVPAGVSARVWQAIAGGAGGAGGRDAGWSGWRRRALIAGFPVLIALANRARLGPLTADLSGAELRRGGLRGFGEVVARLSIAAPYVIFGHTHRAGPLPGDDGAEWRAPGAAALLNTGCWVREPAFLGPDPSTSPYRAGFAATVGDDRPPALTCLLDPG